MFAVRKRYEILKNVMKENRILHQPSSCMQLILECAAAANMATEAVKQADNELSLEHPHLSSFYHVLALLVFAEHIAKINQLVGKAKLEEDPHVALAFVAELIECVFHLDSGADRIPSIVKAFVKRSGLKSQYVENTARVIHCNALFDTVLDFNQ